MAGRGEPQNLDECAVASRGISQTHLQNLAKFSAENCGPYSWYRLYAKVSWLQERSRQRVMGHAISAITTMYYLRPILNLFYTNPATGCYMNKTILQYNSL